MSDKKLKSYDEKYLSNFRASYSYLWHSEKVFQLLLINFQIRSASRLTVRAKISKTAINMNINISINTYIRIIMIDRSKHKCSRNIKQHAKTIKKLDPVGSTVRYEMIKLCRGDFLRSRPFVTVWHLKIMFQMLWDRAKNDFTYSSTYPKDNKNIIGPPPRYLMNQHGLFEFSGMSHSDAG